MTQSKRLVYFGNERLVSGLKHTELPILSALHAHGYDIAAIVVHEKPSTSRNARQLEVVQFANDHNIPVLSPTSADHIVPRLTDLGVDFAVLASYGSILSKRVLNVFEPVGVINIHPSLLPRYRGPTPIESSILSGDKETGVTIMKLSEAMDEGDIYAQSRIPVSQVDDKISLYNKLAKIAAELLIDTLESISNNQSTLTKQTNTDVSYTSRLKKQDGIINPLTDTATDIERQVRAYLNYPKSSLRLMDNSVIITSVKVVDSLSSSALTVQCADETYLEIVQLIAPSGKTMSGSDYIRGYTKKDP